MSRSSSFLHEGEQNEGLLIMLMSKLGRKGEDKVFEKKFGIKNIQKKKRLCDFFSHSFGNYDFALKSPPKIRQCNKRSDDKKSGFRKKSGSKESFHIFDTLSSALWRSIMNFVLLKKTMAMFPFISP